MSGDRRWDRDEFRPHDYNVMCQRTGMKVKASETQVEWNGLRVRRDWYEPRQPQDFVQGRADRQSVPDPRPEPDDAFVDPDDVDPDTDY